MLHKIKQQIQPERDGSSWQSTIAEARQAIRDDIRDSPSLRRYLAENLQEIYADAKEMALIETRLDYSPVPDDCPWDLDGLLE
jgi:hypothetical protein